MNVVRRIDKPRIRRSGFGNHWVCEGQGFGGMGRTPAEAYRRWERILKAHSRG